MQFSKCHPSLFILLFAFMLFQCSNPTKAPESAFDNYLLLWQDDESSAYVDQEGKHVISAGKYADILTDTFRTYAMVLIDSVGYVVINRDEEVLYQVFNFDNGPDYPEDGLFRIIQKEKIGYADQASMEIVIPAQFDCAFPFENGKAKVSTDCKTESDGEYSTWISEKWYFIDKSGQKISAD